MTSRWYLTALPLLIACGHGRLQSAGDLYRKSEALWRRGFTQKAIEVAGQGWRQWKDEPAAEWHWKFRLLNAELLLNQGSSARALRLLEGGGVSPPSAELKTRYLADLGHARKDPALVDQAFDLACRQGYTSLLPAIELKRANLDRYNLRSDAYLHNGLALARAQSDTFLEASTLLDLGFQRLNMSWFDKAIPWLEKAEAAALRAGADRVRERALGNLGWCYYRLGDFDRALSSLSAAAALARQIDDDYVYRWLNNIGNVYFRRRDYGQAISHYQTAADLAKRANNRPWLALTLNNLAATCLEKEDFACAEDFNRRASVLASEARNEESILYARLHMARIEAGRKQTSQAESSFRSVIALAGERQRPIVLWEAEADLARQLHATGREAEADTEFRNALAPIEKEWSKLGEDRHKITFLSQLIAFYGDYVDFLVSRGEVDRAAAVADSSRARVLAEKLDKEPGAGPLGIRPRKGGPILLSYWLGPARSYLWLIGPKGISHFTLPGEARIAGLVNQYAAAIERNQDPLGRDNPAGRELFRILLAPARSLIPPKASVIVIPDGSLHGLNFETLIVDDPAPHYWIEDVTVAVAPALGLLQAAPSPRARPARMLFLGDPAPADTDFPALPHLKVEADIVRQNFPASARTVLTREDANPRAYRDANPGGYTHIHFAAHALANAESPLNSAVVLSRIGEEYKLYAEDVIKQPLQADLVTISACRSAVAKSYAGEGLLGFTWAFMQAGARNVIAGLWNADDEATAEMMGAFYKSLVSGARPAEALRQAKLKLVRSRDPKRLPYFWGTLQLFTRELGG